MAAIADLSVKRAIHRRGGHAAERGERDRDRTHATAEGAHGAAAKQARVDRRAAPRHARLCHRDPAARRTGCRTNRPACVSRPAAGPGFTRAEASTSNAADPRRSHQTISQAPGGRTRPTSGTRQTEPHSLAHEQRLFTRIGPSSGTGAGRLSPCSRTNIASSTAAHRSTGHTTDDSGHRGTNAFKPTAVNSTGSSAFSATAVNSTGRATPHAIIGANGCAWMGVRRRESSTHWPTRKGRRRLAVRDRRQPPLKPGPPKRCQRWRCATFVCRPYWRGVGSPRRNVSRVASRRRLPGKVGRRTIAGRRQFRSFSRRR